ncbi:MAG TPA: outer membrane beta-barrel protein [Hyphomicrobiaceae bacterium]|nr:outer membrane beta-barrel protein [Hyphomicrobiaceae bacterium]
MLAVWLRAAMAVIGTGVLAGAACADGMPSGPRPYTPVYAPDLAPTITYDWSGLYFGGQIGGANSRIEWTYSPIAEEFSQSHTAFAGGGHVGLQKQWSLFVFGAEASYLWMDQEESTVSFIDPTTRVSSNVRNLMLVTGKFGWAWENLLATFRGGWASADIDLRTSVTGTGVLLTTSSDRESGWTAGASVEYALWNHVVLGAQYDYVHFNVGDRLQIPSGAGPVGTRSAGGVDIQSVTARLSFKFGGPTYDPGSIPVK